MSSTNSNQQNIFDIICGGSVDDIKEIYKRIPLTQRLASLNTCNQQSQTPLLFALQKKSFFVVRLFVAMTKTLITKKLKKLNKMYAECSADDPAEEYAEKIRLAVTSQLLEEESLSIISDLVNHISFYKLIDYFVDVEYDKPSWLDFILHSITSNSKISRKDKIMANELMGAAFIFKGSRTPNPPLLFARASYCEGRRGLQYWRVALRLRSSQAADSPEIPKIPLILSEAARNAIGDAAEVNTVDELNEMETDLLLNGYHCLVVQALLYCMRIFEQIIPEHHELYSFHLRNLLKYAKCLTQEKNLSDQETKRTRAIDTSLFILEHCKDYTANSSPECIYYFMKTLQLVFDVLSNKANVNRSMNLYAVIKGTLGVANLFLISPVIPRINEEANWIQFFKYLHLFVERQFEFCDQNEMEKESLNGYFGHLFQLEIRRNGKSTLLHYAVKQFLSSSDENRSVRTSVIKFLLHSGANPQTINENEKSAFRILAENCQSSTEEWYSVFECMLEKGGQLHEVLTSDNTTVLRILKEHENHAYANISDVKKLNSWLQKWTLPQVDSEK